MLEHLISYTRLYRAWTLLQVTHTLRTNYSWSVWPFVYVRSLLTLTTILNQSNNVMTNYPTRKITLRTRKGLVEQIKTHGKLNTIARLALSDYVRQIRLNPLTKDQAEALVRYNKHADELVPTTYRLREIDLDFLKLSCYNISAVLDAALVMYLQNNAQRT